ncbi:Arylsulfatase [Pontiella desulfatans]|uniref:Arylsulfatase n=1 Tax=Pontiella desulfatans TaxID=2750659 RepID=A0A6C2TW68_PONDE|nr:sulfatase-like hydrolase/transferase [Pontiella desulfatans]SPS73624.1 sulfatase S1_24 [Kiritimatiellales bacterium]VGO11910.1 Arylsulfatase [Pontiella desulfatans]
MKPSGIIFFSGALLAASAWAKADSPATGLSKPNIIVYFADDISARELPVYGSAVWSKPERGDTSDPALRAVTPVLDRLATEGCWIKTAWAACVCNPSRAMMMSGRYAHITKWWNNKDKGLSYDEQGKLSTYPVYESSPLLIGHVAQKAGYGTYWSGKTQMAGGYAEHGFDEGCFTPGSLSDTDNPYTDLKHVYKKVNGEKVLVNVDNGEICDTYLQHGWNFCPHVKLMNHPTDPGKTVWWPNTPEAKKRFGLSTFGPDVEQAFSIDFMERMHQQGKPFFIYHTTHLGHGAWDWLTPANGQCWPGTPKIAWEGGRYTRTEPVVTGDNGVYDLHGTITEPGMHSHINYIDYQIWRYRQKLEEMGIAENTVIVFCADNGSAEYGKNKGEQQKGCHVPMIIYAPGMKKQGGQDVLVSLADIMPTIADLVGFEIPADYEVNGKSLVPFLYTDGKEHRDWLYTQRGPEQLIRGTHVLKDGRDQWWNVADNPADLISFSEIREWGGVSEVHRAEREELLHILPDFDLYYEEFNAPGVPGGSTFNPKRYGRKPEEVAKPAPPAKKEPPRSMPSATPKGQGKTKDAFCSWKKTEMEKKGKTYVQAQVEKLFDQIDANQDGLATKEEQKAYYAK